MPPTKNISHTIHAQKLLTENSKPSSLNEVLSAIVRLRMKLVNNCCCTRTLCSDDAIACASRTASHAFLGSFRNRSSRESGFSRASFLSCRILALNVGERSFWLALRSNSLQEIGRAHV